ncbi:unnamed protein product [Taenia asiatica]|uniref:Uncharacterized protein n=1 Tax=Taenia asiatica TaxID=60517 RepID=A0A0R3VXD1_TAEAS|nr:unnamed protein product [Taenia asiatica]
MGDRAVNALASNHPPVLISCSINYYSLKPMRSSCGDVRWNFSCVFPVQMTDRLIAEEELYFGYDVDIISAPGAKRRIHEPCHAYRPVVWNHFERFSNKLAMYFGFLEEVINGPLYSIVAFVNKEFVGPLVDLPNGSITLPGDVIITVMEGFFEIDVYPPKSEVRGVIVSGDVVYIPHQFKHRAKLSDCGTSHAIVLCVINRALVFVEECGEHLLKELKLKEPKNNGCSLLHELLTSTHNNPKKASDILYIGLNAEEGGEFIFRMWLKGVDGVCRWNEKQAIGHAAVKLDPSELSLVCVLARS